MSEMITLTASSEDKGKRIDKFISENVPELTRSAVQGLIERGLVRVSGSNVSKNYKLRDGDAVEAEIPEPEPMDAVAEDIPLNIVYEDRDLLVVNKPKGMVVHPAHGNYTGTLVNA
jgi:23S rRNA pseudouridine1911/1915/1917 synthase